MRIGRWQIRRTQSVPVQQPLLPGLLVTEDLAAQHLSSEARTILARVVRGMIKDLIGDLSEDPGKLITPTIREHIERLARAAANDTIVSHVFSGINVLEATNDANPLSFQRPDGALGLRVADQADDPPAEQVGS